jgi:hypothetical protein
MFECGFPPDNKGCAYTVFWSSREEQALHAFIRWTVVTDM